MSTTFDAAAEYASIIKDADAAMALVNTIKSAVNGAGKYAAYVAANDVTRDNVKDHARALAMLTYPNDAPVQKKDGVRTRFGNAVQAAGNGLRAALGKDESSANTDWLRLVRQAAENAQNKGEYSVDVILANVREALNGADEGMGDLTAVA